MESQHIYLSAMFSYSLFSYCLWLQEYHKKTAKKLNFGKHLMLSHGEEDSGGRENDSILANTFEAVIGALFLDQGIDAVRTFLFAVLIPEIEEYVQKKVFKDPKSLLQEYVQARKQNSPNYRVIREEGPAHAKQFTIGVFVGENQVGEGKGKLGEGKGNGTLYICKYIYILLISIT